MRILIADDNPLVRSGIIRLLAQEDGIKVCGEAADAADAIQKVTELQPEMILLDISMPGGNGLETARILKQKFPETKILIISQHDPKQILPRSIEVGANGTTRDRSIADDQKSSKRVR
jgi:DNA-binding NarL/FixJ family response regulator